MSIKNTYRNIINVNGQHTYKLAPVTLIVHVASQHQTTGIIKLSNNSYTYKVQ